MSGGNFSVSDTHDRGGEIRARYHAPHGDAGHHREFVALHIADTRQVVTAWRNGAVALNLSMDEQAAAIVYLSVDRAVEMRDALDAAIAEAGVPTVGEVAA
jgi:hypothetical protein